MIRQPMRRSFERALPRIERHARVYFRAVRCPHRREDLIAEALALSWRWWVRLKRRGRSPEEFVSALATYAARAAGCGRRLCGQEKARDVLSPRAQRVHAFTVGTLPGCATLSGNPFAEALADNTATPPDEQACFRLDFPAFVGTLSDRDRRLLARMMVGEGTGRLAAQFGISPARVSQKRREFRDGWDRFTADGREEG